METMVAWTAQLLCQHGGSGCTPLDAAILDVGTGNGVLPLQLARLGFTNVTGAQQTSLNLLPLAATCMHTCCACSAKVVTGADFGCAARTTRAFPVQDVLREEADGQCVFARAVAGSDYSEAAVELARSIAARRGVASVHWRVDDFLHSAIAERCAPPACCCQILPPRYACMACSRGCFLVLRHAC
jgi:hypothetical protein